MIPRRLLLLALLALGARAADPAAAGGQAALPVWSYADLPLPRSAARRRVVLDTRWGPIPIALLDDNAPAAADLVWDAAGGAECTGCNFYRGEARPPPEAPSGPPYALLQGSMPALARAPALEGTLPLAAGHVAQIPDTTEFFISLSPHSEWAGAMTVWGELDGSLGWVAVEMIAAQNFTDFKHPDYETAMRMLVDKAPFRLRRA